MQNCTTLTIWAFYTIYHRLKMAFFEYFFERFVQKIFFDKNNGKSIDKPKK